MSVIALVNPATLLGQGVRESLGARSFEHDVRLLTSEAEAEGTLTEIGGEVALIHTLTREALAEADLVIACGSPDDLSEAAALVPDGTPCLVVANSIEHPAGVLAIAGIGESPPLGEAVIVSPHPAVVALTHLLSPLMKLNPARVAATVLLPTSIQDARGLDELFGQTRDILNFQSEQPQEVFGHQLAFNILPTTQGSTIGAQVTQILGAEAEIAVQLLQAPVFHSLSISALVEFGQDAVSDDIHDALHEVPGVALADTPETLGPIDAAASEELLVGPIQQIDSWPGAWSIWAVMNNLTRGGASNAVEIAVQLLG